jgi:hypothetical protein
MVSLERECVTGNPAGINSNRKNPNPGILRALVSGSLQNGLHLGVNDPLFDRKLLNYLHEQEV